MSKTESTGNDAQEPAADPFEADYPEGLDPDNIPDGIEELYIAKARQSRRRYHLDNDCSKLKREVETRRPNIAAAWYRPCKYCVTGEYPLSEDDYKEGGDREDAAFARPQEIRLRAASGEFDDDD